MGTRIYIGNLLYQASREDVANLLLGNGFSNASVDMSIDAYTGRNPSYCFVDFETPEEADRALSELNGKPIMGRPVKAKPGVPKKTDRAERLRVVFSQRGWHREEPKGDSVKPTFDRWRRTDQPTHWNVRHNDEYAYRERRLWVGNLPRMEPQSAVDQAMQELFSLVGVELAAVSKIISPHQSKEGKPGDHFYLFVDLVKYEDVEVAIGQLHGTTPTFASMPISVRQARDTGGESKVQRDKGAMYKAAWMEKTSWRETPRIE